VTGARTFECTGDRCPRSVYLGWLVLRIGTRLHIIGAR
jgi:hypothetical protein